MPEISFVAQPSPFQLQQEFHAVPRSRSLLLFFFFPVAGREPTAATPPVPVFQERGGGALPPPQGRVQGVRPRVGFVQEEGEDGHVAGGQLGPHHLEKPMEGNHPIILQAFFFLPRDRGSPGHGGTRGGPVVVVPPPWGVELGESTEGLHRRG